MDNPRSADELIKLLREAEERVEEERRRADEAEKNRQDERRRADEAEKNRQDERRRADEAEKNRQDERRRADEAEKNRQDERRRADEAEAQTRPTTLSEPWSDFLDLQKTTFGLLFATFPAERRAFESRNFLNGLGNRISQRSIANEKTLEYFQHNSVEDPVRCIMDQLKEVEDTKDEFGLGNGIIFENHPNAISDVSEEVVERLNPPSTPLQTPGHGRDLHQLRPDQICVYRSDDDGLPTVRTMVYVVEYKAPHKLTAPHLRVGLRPMDIYKEVVNRKTIPTSADPDALFQYHAERLTAAAITQTYHYMIEGGLDYGLLTTGETIVFLKVNWEEPETLYYHLAEPGPEALAHPDHVQLCAAVGQYLAFSLMALGPERRQHGQEERQQAVGRLKRWTEDFETTLRSIPKDERTAPDSSPGYTATTYSDVDRSPYPIRANRRPRAGQDEPERETPRRDASEPSDDEPAPPFPDTPTPAERRRRGRGQGPRRSRRLAERPRGRSQQGRQYCTQLCLLGLVRGDFLDLTCPNVESHVGRDYVASAPCRHPVSHNEWLRLLRKQLEQSLDDGITRLGLGGARGVLFKVTLLAYGYTLVCKGTVQAFIQDLEHEAAVYKRLGRIQGINVPVFLGAIDLRSMNKIYYYDFRVYVVHMTFLSWGGHSMVKGEPAGNTKKLENKAIRSLQAMHREGVVHKDVRRENMLFNPETNAVMMIDFERASLLERPRRPLGRLVPNKRAWEQNEEDGGERADRLSKKAQRSNVYWLDIANAQAAFCLRGR
ncbi:hypothetical protein QQZ08_012211 [Neonectria magnoliae]|uniref:EKC/KEOPS complex subunit BUD32 n=1 Tax=Neonectria magnoliae TaxID=2732573 RepID=A0ABR1H461_9HYPO